MLNKISRLSETQTSEVNSRRRDVVCFIDRRLSTVLSMNNGEHPSFLIRSINSTEVKVKVKFTIARTKPG